MGEGIKKRYIRLGVARQNIRTLHRKMNETAFGKIYYIDTGFTGWTNWVGKWKTNGA